MSGLNLFSLLPRFHRSLRSARLALLAVLIISSAGISAAQNVPLVSGGIGFFNTDAAGGQKSYLPIMEPLLAMPIGPHFMIESRAALLSSITPNPPGGPRPPGYDHNTFMGLTYLQANYIATPKLTIVGGTFLLPFNTYNERLTPIWISNFQNGPLISGLGTMSTGVGTGGMLRGTVISTNKFQLSYATYFSSRTDPVNFASKRSQGERVSAYLPKARVEGGLSYGRLLQGTRENFYGAFLWWEPKDTAFRLRSEFARGHHAQGYWVEADYRTKAFGGLDSFVGRFEPLFRLQQTFRRDSNVSDGLPLVNTQVADFGLDYNLPHETRILTSYSRQFSSTGNFNTWQTGIVYRFLLPTWKGK